MKESKYQLESYNNVESASVPAITKPGRTSRRTKIFVILIVGLGTMSLMYSYNSIQEEGARNRGEEKWKHVEISTNTGIGGTKRIPRVLCWVMTTPENHETKVVHVKQTWGSRCNKLIFMSTENDTALGVVGLENVTEGYNWLWQKTRAAFKYVWENHEGDADWFLKADDDTYVIVENLKYLLSKHDPTKPIFFGCRFKTYYKDEGHKNGYMSGGAGYVLSKEAVRRFAEMPSDHKCFENPEGAEDNEMGRCLEDVGVSFGDARDKFGRHRFMPFDPPIHFTEGYMPQDFWYWSFSVYPQKVGKECCSETAISFHYIQPDYMYFLDYLLYHIKSYTLFPSKSNSNTTLARGQKISAISP